MVPSIAQENRESIKTYGAVTPFLLLRGKPADFPAAMPLDPATMVKLNADCARKQVEIAKKRNSYAEYIGDNDDCNAEKHAYNVNDVVRAKRGGTVRHKDPYAEGV